MTPIILFACCVMGILVLFCVIAFLTASTGHFARKDINGYRIPVDAYGCELEPCGYDEAIYWIRDSKCGVSYKCPWDGGVIFLPNGVKLRVSKDILNIISKDVHYA